MDRLGTFHEGPTDHRAAKEPDTEVRAAGLINLLPTLPDLCGVKTPPDLDGVSLVPLLQNPTKEMKRRLITTLHRGNHAVRTDRWRYILAKDGSGGLYKLQTDPHEWENLSRDPKCREVITRLRGKL